MDARLPVAGCASSQAHDQVAPASHQEELRVPSVSRDVGRSGIQAGHWSCGRVDGQHHLVNGRLASVIYSRPFPRNSDRPGYVRMRRASSNSASALFPAAAASHPPEHNDALVGIHRGPPL